MRSKEELNAFLDARFGAKNPSAAWSKAASPAETKLFRVELRSEATEELDAFLDRLQNRGSGVKAVKESAANKVGENKQAAEMALSEGGSPASAPELATCKEEVEAELDRLLLAREEEKQKQHRIVLARLLTAIEQEEENLRARELRKSATCLETRFSENSASEPSPRGGGRKHQQRVFRKSVALPEDTGKKLNTKQLWQLVEEYAFATGFMSEPGDSSSTLLLDIDELTDELLDDLSRLPSSASRYSSRSEIADIYQLLFAEERQECIDEAVRKENFLQGFAQWLAVAKMGRGKREQRESKKPSSRTLVITQRRSALSRSLERDYANLTWAAWEADVSPPVLPSESSLQKTPPAPLRSFDAAARERLLTILRGRKTERDEYFGRMLRPYGGASYPIKTKPAAVPSINPSSNANVDQLLEEGLIDEDSFENYASDELDRHLLDLEFSDLFDSKDVFLEDGVSSVDDWWLEGQKREGRAEKRTPLVTAEAANQATDADLPDATATTSSLPAGTAAPEAVVVPEATAPAVPTSISTVSSRPSTPTTSATNTAFASSTCPSVDVTDGDDTSTDHDSPLLLDKSYKILPNEIPVGALLIGHPLGPYFQRNLHRAVILITENSEEQCAGLILNKPFLGRGTAASPLDLIHLGGSRLPLEVTHRGGDCEIVSGGSTSTTLAGGGTKVENPNRGAAKRYHVLHTCGDVEGAVGVNAAETGLYLDGNMEQLGFSATAMKDGVAATSAEAENREKTTFLKLRAFAGTCLWARGQLETEVERNLWLMVRPSAPTTALFFPPKERTLWGEMMSDLGYGTQAALPDFRRLGLELDKKIDQLFARHMEHYYRNIKDHMK
eukprot:g17181.t1